MSLNTLRASIVFVATAFSASALAYDFSKADTLYQKREDLASLNQARAEYELALQSGSLTNDEKVYAVESASRLDYYQGLVVTDIESQKTIFGKCMERVESIKPGVVPATPAYYYWKGTCMASWGRANGVLVSLNRSKELVEVLTAGKALDSTYEGGGFDRVLSAVFLRLPAINPFGPSGDKQKAFAYSDAAVSAAAYGGAADPATATGDYFFNVYEFRAEILEALGKKAEAISLLNTAIARIDSGDYAPDRNPETKVHRAVLVTLLAKLQQ